MKKEELLKALNTTERLLPDSDLARELRKIAETDEEIEQKKKYIEMLAKNEFQTRDEIEKLSVSFKDELLFFYDMGNFKPTEEEKNKVQDLTELLDLLDAERFMEEKQEVEQELEIFRFKERLSQESWGDVVDTTSMEVIERYPKFRNLFRRFYSLLDLVR